MRDNFVCKSGDLKKFKNSTDLPLQTYLGPLGMTGQTAYIGLLIMGKYKRDKVFLYLQQVEVLDQQFVKLQKI